MKPKPPVAFPVPYPSAHFGMSLRDYFAGQALTVVGRNDDADEMAQYAYQVADAMLKRRERE